ncbi:MAG TPA: 4-hydroxy-3-methylbut-2-en-1-yl diphosphate synthase, partial [Kosmotogaceae bacterium]|nr:4-hydroxy-3-methylbut-2-en-1-yl diphosphate synthase [Kosmotogaceae bacterium]
MIRPIKIGNVLLGTANTIVIQSMTDTRTTDIEATIAQINTLQIAGCELVRVAVPDFESAHAIREIASRTSVPLIADIHFDYRLALEAMKCGASKIRINPGNIGPEDKVAEIVKVARERSIPIRVGSNTGSIKSAYLNKYDRATALAESALDQVRLLERLGFEQIVISAKSSSVVENYESNVYIRKKTEYPIHLGITEAGIGDAATVKSSVGIGALLMQGIGETIRVSITGDPLREVHIARTLLSAIGKRSEPQLISCPTCARTEIDVEVLARDVERWLSESRISAPITVAVMGCVVNGIGEGKHADLGIAGT